MNDGRRALSALHALLLAISPLTVAAESPETLTPAQMREDLIYLRDVWAQLDKSFSKDERSAFTRIVDGALSRVDTLTPADFSLEVARAVAVSRNGHTESDLGPWFHGLPFKAFWFRDGLYIVRAHSKFSELLGARIEKIGSLPPEEAVKRVAPFISGTDEWIRYVSPSFLRLAEMLQRIGATRDAAKISLSIQRRDGTKEIVTLRSGDWAADPDPGSPWMALIPTGRDVSGRWLQVLDDAKEVPLTYQRPNDVSWHWIGRDGRVLYVRSNQIFGLGKDHYAVMAKLLEVVQDQVVPRRPKFVIVDLRHNHGGDLTNTTSFAQALPRLMPADGKIYVLVGTSTFSAALVTAAMLKGNGRDAVVLAGEPMGDRNPFWAEGRPHPLPNSKIGVTPAGWMHDWSNGCEELDNCYWANVVFGARDVALDPEIRIAPIFADYAAARDPVLDAVLARMQ